MEVSTTDAQYIYIPHLKHTVWQNLTDCMSGMPVMVQKLIKVCFVVNCVFCYSFYATGIQNWMSVSTFQSWFRSVFFFLRWQINSIDNGHNYSSVSANVSLMWHISTIRKISTMQKLIIIWLKLGKYWRPLSMHFYELSYIDAFTCCIELCGYSMEQWKLNSSTSRTLSCSQAGCPRFGRSFFKPSTEKDIN